jgi:hypothetical protein
LILRDPLNKLDGMTGDDWMLWIAKIIGASVLIPLAGYCLFWMVLTGLEQRRKRRTGR